MAQNKDFNKVIATQKVMVESKSHNIRFETDLESEVKGFMKGAGLGDFSKAVKQLLRQRLATQQYRNHLLEEIRQHIKKFGYTPREIFPEFRRRSYMGKEVFTRESR